LGSIDSPESVSRAPITEASARPDRDGLPRGSSWVTLSSDDGFQAVKTP
jgi:hypothetical protein